MVANLATLLTLLTLGLKEVVFKLRPGHEGSEAVITSLVANASGLGVPTRIFRHAGRFEERHRAFGLDRWYVAEAKALPDESVRLLEAQSSLIELPSARYDVRMLGAPNDPRYSEQPHLPAVGLPAAWSITAGDPSVVVAVVGLEPANGAPHLA